MGDRLTRSKTPVGVPAIRLAYKGKESVEESGELKSVESGPDNAALAVASSSGGPSHPNSSASAKSKPGRARSTGPGHATASTSTATARPNNSASVNPRSRRALSIGPASSSKAATQRKAGKKSGEKKLALGDGAAVAPVTEGSSSTTIAPTPTPLPLRSASGSRSVHVDEVEDREIEDSRKRSTLPPDSPRILETVHETDGLEDEEGSRRPRESGTVSPQSRPRDPLRSSTPLFYPDSDDDGDTESRPAVPVRHRARHRLPKRSLEEMLVDGHGSPPPPADDARAPSPLQPPPPPADDARAPSPLQPPLPPADDARPPSPLESPPPLPDPTSTEPLAPLLEIAGEPDAQPLPGAESKTRKPSLEDILGAGLEDDDDDYDGLDQAPRDSETKPVYARGPLSKEDMDTVLALVEAFDKGLVEVARKSNKPLSHIYRLAMPHLKLSRKPNLFNLYIKRYCYLHKKNPDESFAALRERFLSAYREEVGSMTPEEKKALRNELIQWNENFEQHHAKRVQQDGDLYKIMLQARVEFEVLAQYYYRFFDIAAFGWVVSIRPGDATAMQANSTFASTTAAVKFMDQMGSAVPQAMDQFASVVKIHKAAEVSMSDWSVTRENIVIAAGGEAVKKRFTQFLIGLQNQATGRNRTFCQWQYFGMELVDARKVITKWMPEADTPDAKKSILNKMDILKKFVRIVFSIQRGDVDERYHTCVRDMTDAEKKLAKSKKTLHAWKQVPIIEDWNFIGLLTVGDAMREGYRANKEVIVVDDDDDDASDAEPEIAEPPKKKVKTSSGAKHAQLDKETAKEGRAREKARAHDVKSREKEKAKEARAREKARKKAREQVARVLTKAGSTKPTAPTRDRATSSPPPTSTARRLPKRDPGYYEVDSDSGGDVSVTRKRKRSESAPDNELEGTSSRGRSGSRRVVSSSSSSSASSSRERPPRRVTRSASRPATGAVPAQLGGGGSADGLTAESGALAAGESSLANALGEYVGHRSAQRSAIDETVVAGPDPATGPLALNTSQPDASEPGGSNTLDVPWSWPALQQLPNVFDTQPATFAQPYTEQFGDYGNIFGLQNAPVGLQSVDSFAGLDLLGSLNASGLGAVPGTSLGLSMSTPAAAVQYSVPPPASYAHAAPSTDPRATPAPSSDSLQQEISQMRGLLAQLQSAIGARSGATVPAPAVHGHGASGQDRFTAQPPPPPPQQRYDGYGTGPGAGWPSYPGPAAQ